VGVATRVDGPKPPQSFYTVTAEIALSRHEVRVAALEYAAASEAETDTDLLRRATDVTAECLQPSLTLRVANRWLEIDPAAIDAHRAAARAALELHQIDQSTAHYRAVLRSSPRGPEAEFATLDGELAGADNIYGARQVADRLQASFPDSQGALRVKAFATLRADDPAAAARAFTAALAVKGEASVGEPGPAADDLERHELTQGLWRARVLAGEPQEPLAQAKALLEQSDTADNRLDYALLLLAAQQNSAARAQLSMLTHDHAAGPMALRLLGLVDYQDGKLDDASARFAQLITTGKFLDDALYYLGLIAERHDDFERALRFYAQVQNGENGVSAVLRAASILRAHGAGPAAEEILDQLVEDEPQRAPEILAARARIYADAGDVPQAIAILDSGQAQYPDSVELRYAMASMAEEQGQISDALHALKEVAAHRPDDPAALNAYGYTLADSNRRLKLARRLIEQAYAAAPKSPAILDSLGWVLYRQGHGDQALPYLNAAYADEHDGDIAAHLGEVLWRLGRQDDAERIWSEASRTSSGNHLLKATRLRLHASN